MMKYFKLILAMLFMTLFMNCSDAQDSTQGETNKTTTSQSVPITHIMVCCRDANMGTTFLVNGKWNPAHDYSDINQVRDILQKIKDAGINIVSIDFTNPSQWNTGDVKGEPLLWSMFHPMLLNIAQVCKEKNMQYFLFLGNSVAWSLKYWNGIAQKIWENWAQTSQYRKYGFGDNRPMIIMFLPGTEFWKQYNAAPDSEKNYLAKFHIGTCEVNQAIQPVESDGWGYRNFVESSDGKVRFACPNGGIGPDSWYRVDATEWQRRVEWAGQAKQYTVFGSYDDTCDAIFWGIADVSKAEKKVHVNSSTVSDPYAYYNIVKNYLTKRNAKK
jgi:hypothetical protein